jgi:hypothetical protein
LRKNVVMRMLYVTSLEAENVSIVIYFHYKKGSKVFVNE